MVLLPSIPQKLIPGGGFAARWRGGRGKKTLMEGYGRLKPFFLYIFVFCFVGVWQEEVDMMVGLTDTQAGKIAKHLKLQEGGPSYEAVREGKNKQKDSVYYRGNPNVKKSVTTKGAGDVGCCELLTHRIICLSIPLVSVSLPSRTVALFFAFGGEY